MTTYAHIETGQALDPWENDSQDEYLARFSGVDTDAWTVVSVPVGTKHGAKANGDGTYTNPSISPPPASFRSIDKAQFQSLYAANGNDLTATLASWPTT